MQRAYAHPRPLAALLVCLLLILILLSFLPHGERVQVRRKLECMHLGEKSDDPSQREFRSDSLLISHNVPAGAAAPSKRLAHGLICLASPPWLLRSCALPAHLPDSGLLLLPRFRQAHTSHCARAPRDSPRLSWRS
ncbi:hypothetical protein PYCCODRAFT_1014739 [Trametes coccinea BRFM310]|uniref:Uncharacterized protein n=1 Tax=Trametes coccinea (strain BRFM310) TaxID=1353009 RepID=A0A1Y2IAV6_TRAC3|nr:hypothetical protein PYCCODRAFT_1014739 [Trametes coccinea BRFM310]